MAPKYIYRIKDLITLLSVSRSTIYEWIAAGSFPKPIRLGPNSVGWTEPSIKEWVDSRAPSA